MHTFSHRLGASAVSISVDGRRGGRGLSGGSRSVKVVGVCGIESGRCNQLWRVGILSNDMTSKTSAESSHFGPTMIT
jgi:hypothetical protein